MKYRLIRENENKTNLPDEIIELIFSYISPVQLCLSGWKRVSKGFKDMLRQVCKSYRVLNTIKGPDCKFFEQFYSPLVYEDTKLIRKLEVIIGDVFPHVTMLTVSAGIISIVLQCIVKYEPTLLMPKLRFIHIVLGDKYGALTNGYAFNDILVARRFASGLKFVELSVTLSPNSGKLITCCSFRKLVRLLVETAEKDSVWSLCLKDKTKRAQGWFNPSELSSYRVIAFIAYVRTILEMGVVLHKLELIDDLKISPYMMVMKQKRRFLYMYDEYKQCEKLTICYDVGIVAPSFPRFDEKYHKLQEVEIISSHVLYKNDFLSYLSLAPNIKVVRILLPYRWTERVERCAFGCFLNADFACFMKYGWASLPQYLPHASLIFC